MVIIKDDVIKIRQATQQGYIEIPLDAIRGGTYVVDLSFPTSKLRRGRVQGDGHICPTITTTGGLYVFKEIE